MCPKCKQPLIVVEFQGVELDYCPGCRGTWFDAGELELVAELAGSAPGRLQRALHSAGGQSAGSRRCPRCRRKMQVVTVGQTPPVEIDRCPSGDGIWLDAGELATIVKEFVDSEDAVVAEFFGDLFRDDLAGQTEVDRP